MPAYTDLRIDSVFIYQQISRSLRVDVILTGAEIYAEGMAGKEGTEWNLVQTWTYTGENTFLGFSTNSSSSFPDSGLAVGESTTYGGSEGTVNLYSVAAVPSPITENTKVMLLNGNAVLNNNNILVSDASEFVSGSQTITEDGTYDVTNLASVTVTTSGSSGGTTTVTFSMTPGGDDYDITYVDANGNTVDTSYWTLDTEYSGSVTVNATSNTPIATSCVSPLIETIPTPTNTSSFSSKTGQAGTKPPVNYAFQTFIVD